MTAAANDTSEGVDGSVDQVVGPYRLRFEIAAGGMAKVYLAVKEGPGGFSKVVAIKRIHDHLANESDFVEMFLDEARIASQIDHPNVCSIVDFGHADGTHYLAMEYMMGESFRAVLKALGRADLPESARSPVYAARIVAEVCEGLHAAHELRDASGALLSVVHRDVSPQNVFLTYDGAVKVMDFGIATARDRVHHTETGTVKGKFGYMAPEQVRGHAVDRRADVWALGVLLWESLARARLFTRKNDAETVLAVLGDKVPSLVPLRGSEMVELDRIVAKALDRDLDRRYATARELGRDLAKWIASRNEVVGAVELAEWMAKLFPGGLASRSQLARLARTNRNVPLVRSEHTGSMSTAASRVREKIDDAASGTTKTRHRVAIGVLVGAALLALVALALTIAQSAQEPEPPVAVRPSPPPSVAPAPPPIAAPPPSVAPAPVLTVAVAVVPAPARPAPPRRRASVEAASGSLDLATPGGWASVYLGTRRLGTSPGRFQLPAGHHTLRLVPFDRAADARTLPVDVRAHESTRARVELRP